MTTVPGATDKPGRTQRWSIRPALASDAEAIGRLHVCCWRSGYADLIDVDFLAGLSEADYVARWQQNLSAPAAGRRTFVAVTSDRIVGFVTVRPSDEPAGLDALYVHDQFWGAGVGYALHRTGSAFLVRAGCRQATLWVLSDNERARRFYRRQGWRPTGGSKTDVRGSVALQESELILDLTAR